MRVLLTGATSMLGRSTAERLTATGHAVTVFQRGKSGLDLPEIRGNVSSTSDVEGAMEGQEAVVHLAAKVSVSGSLADFERINVGGTENVISAARSAGVSRLVYVSSPSVAHDGTPLVGAGAGPADPSLTRGHYSTTKARAELLALASSDNDLSVVVVRPHLVWGPGDTQLVGRIVDRARSGRLALIGTGLALIDSIYVDNAADALVSALDRSPALAGRSFVVSNGEPRTVAELVGRIVTAAGLNPPVRSVPQGIAFGGGLVAERVWDFLERSGDPPITSFMAEQLSTAHWFDQRETRKALGWIPTVSLDEGFRRLAASFA